MRTEKQTTCVYIIPYFYLVSYLVLLTHHRLRDTHNIFCVFESFLRGWFINKVKLPQMTGDNDDKNIYNNYIKLSEHRQDICSLFFLEPYYRVEYNGFHEWSQRGDSLLADISRQVSVCDWIPVKVRHITDLLPRIVSETWPFLQKGKCSVQIYLGRALEMRIPVSY